MSADDLSKIQGLVSKVIIGDDPEKAKAELNAKRESEQKDVEKMDTKKKQQDDAAPKKNAN